MDESGFEPEAFPLRTERSTRLNYLPILERTQGNFIKYFLFSDKEYGCGHEY